MITLSLFVSDVETESVVNAPPLPRFSLISLIVSAVNSILYNISSSPACSASATGSTSPRRERERTVQRSAARCRPEPSSGQGRTSPPQQSPTCS